MIKVLVLDDREDYLRALHGSLRKDYDVVLARTIDEAKATFDASFGVALVDVRLSETDETNREGIAFVQWMRIAYPDKPAVLMSAYRDLDVVLDALERGGIDYFLRKPIDLRELRTLLDEFGLRGRIQEKTQEAMRRLKEEDF